MNNILTGFRIVSGHVFRNAGMTYDLQTIDDQRGITSIPFKMLNIPSMKPPLGFSYEPTPCWLYPSTSFDVWLVPYSSSGGSLCPLHMRFGQKSFQIRWNINLDRSHLALGLSSIDIEMLE